MSKYLKYCLFNVEETGRMFTLGEVLNTSSSCNLGVTMVSTQIMLAIFQCTWPKWWCYQKLTQRHIPSVEWWFWSPASNISWILKEAGRSNNWTDTGQEHSNKGGHCWVYPKESCSTLVDDYCSLLCFFHRLVPENDNECSRKPMLTAQGNKLSSHKKRRGRRKESVCNNHNLVQPIWTICGTS